MESSLSEIAYPLTFRQEISTHLGQYLEQRRWVELIGMKRVGISNFLRFFLYHKGVKRKYLPLDGKSLFIPVDLNDLIEREMFPFWRLTFKRIVDAVDASSVGEEVKTHISSLFLSCIQSGDLFLTFDGVRESLVNLVRVGLYPTIFFIRFDRIKDALTPEFLDNLWGIHEATGTKISYVFTSYRELSNLAPQIFQPQKLSTLTRSLYLKPGGKEDMGIIFSTLAERFGVKAPKEIEDFLLEIAGGHVQYLQIMTIIYHEIFQKKKEVTRDELMSVIESDERVSLQSEELWESLVAQEQEVLKKIVQSKEVTEEEKEKAMYLWNAGFVQGKGSIHSLFSSFFAKYIKTKVDKKNTPAEGVEFSKKEHLLFELLKKHVNEISDREEIVEIVWPEYKEYGVSDWSIDRLVARVRGKLHKQKSIYEIVTVRTRGYKLVTQ